MPSGAGAISGIYDLYSEGGSGPAYPRVNAIPPWLPGPGTGELEEQYRNTNTMFDTSDYERSNRQQQGRLLTTALNAGTAAAAEYAARARQAGGSGLGAGLVKAQAQVGAQKTAGDLDLERARYVTEHREAAASHASQIASTLGELRQAYLSNIVNYATSEDRINSEYDLGRRRLRQEGRGRGGAGGAGPFGQFPAIIGQGPFSPFETTHYDTYEDYIRSMGDMQNQYPDLFGG